ncbi:3-oxosteroid 1-dehydrogenase [Fusarium oxysporum f. sp. albedinis]|nr:3-oxosteroid 1-dehydrogenase [Fusarium oxysporum f. sp. albedinis]
MKWTEELIFERGNNQICLWRSFGIGEDKISKKPGTLETMLRKIDPVHVDGIFICRHIRIQSLKHGLHSICNICS